MWLFQPEVLISPAPTVMTDIITIITNNYHGKLGVFDQGELAESVNK